MLCFLFLNMFYLYNSRFYMFEGWITSFLLYLKSLHINGYNRINVGTYNLNIIMDDKQSAI